jgi:hypothetical protein
MDYDQENSQQQVAIIVGEEMFTPEQYEQKKRAQVDGLHQEFTSLRDKWVQYRNQSGVEKRWRTAAELYYGSEDKRAGMFEETLRDGPPSRKVGDSNRSKVVINIVRPKIDQAIARMCEILMPVDDRNWGIKPTPIPEVANMATDERQTIDPQTGEPTGLTAKQEMEFVIEAAKESASNMERSIDDSLTECNYNGESRSVVSSAVKLGTGIMYGPFPTKQTSKVWMPSPDGTQMMIINESIVPASEALDPWDVFFDPSCGNDHQRGKGFFIRRQVTRKELRGLVGLPGYDEECIRQVLRTEPKKVRVAENKVLRETLHDDSYEMWTYHGEIEPEEMQLLTERAGDPLVDISFGVLVIVNDKIIGAMESWVADKSLPIDVWCWRKADDSPYGYGLADELENQQRVVNSAWRQVMDNGRTSLGGQIVMKKGMIIPQDNSWEITPNKIWLAKDDMDDVRNAFTVFEFNSHLQELLAIAQSAMQFADMESGMPQIMGGEQGSAPETVGGMVMLYNNANSVLRQRVKLYDDCITKPHIGRYYDWKMVNDEDPNIKGDFEIDARGSSALIERDIQNQALINLANITNNPRYVPHLKEREELKAILRAFKVNPEEIMKTEDEVAQDQAMLAEQPPPPDPKLLSAEMDMQMKQMDLEDRERQRQFEMERNLRELDFRNQNLSYNVERERAKSAQKQLSDELSREITIAKMAQDGEMTREELERKERLEMIKIQDQRERFNAEAALRVKTGAGI